MQRIDIHSHILPNIDDGSHSVEESIALLSMLKHQGIQTVAATPHFYADHSRPEAFLKRRNEAWERLENARVDSMPTILLGTELLYFHGISMMDCLNDFRITGTKLLLLEMPFEPWSKRTIQELLDIQQSNEFWVILAHIERYFSFQPKQIWEELHDHGVLFQVNANSFLNWRTRGKIIKLLKQEKIHFIASDCHNTKLRAPKLDLAWEKMKRSLNENTMNFLLTTEKKYIPTKDVV